MGFLADFALPEAFITKNTWHPCEVMIIIPALLVPSGVYHLACSRRRVASHQRLRDDVKACPIHGSERESLNCQLLKKIQDNKLNEADAMLKGCHMWTRPDVVSYNYIIQANMTQGNLCRAEELFESMSQDGVAPTAATYNILINSLSRAQDPSGAAVWLQNLVSSGLEATEVSFAKVIRAYVRAGDTENATKWFKRMIVAGIEPTSMSYNLLIQDCARRGDLKSAEVLLAEALAHGHVPGAATCASMIHACAEANDMLQAEKWMMVAEGSETEPRVRNNTTMSAHV